MNDDLVLQHSRLPAYVRAVQADRSCLTDSAEALTALLALETRHNRTLQRQVALHAALNQVLAFAKLL